MILVVGKILNIEILNIGKVFLFLFIYPDLFSRRPLRGDQEATSEIFGSFTKKKKKMFE